MHTPTKTNTNTATKTATNTATNTAFARPVPLVIYHGNCQDGFTAAWAVWLIHPDWEFYPAKHGDPPPSVVHRDVYLLDFCYPALTMTELVWSARSIVILDHHKTAKASMVPFIDTGLVSAKFDTNKSGARLAWEWFHPEEDVPEIVMYVEDRDLWRFKYEDTKAVTAYLFAQPYDFEVWTRFQRMLQYDFSTVDVLLAGNAILDKQAKDVEELCQNKFRVNIGGYEVWCVNLPYTLASDAGALLDVKEPFAATYYFDGRSLVFSLRSDPQGIDVSEIAKIYGGGGHQHAAGFKIDSETLKTLEGLDAKYTA
jgi:uncharacterized protein